MEDQEEITPQDNKMIELPTLKWEGPRNWKNKAACRSLETEVFFSKKNPEPVIAMCRVCDVRLVCLEYAIRNDLTSGIFGGTTKSERKGMKVEDIVYEDIQ